MSVENDDPDSTGNAALEEGTNFWWVPVPVFSKAFYEHVDREAPAVAAAAAAAAAANDTPYVEAVATPAQEKKTAFQLLWTVTKGQNMTHGRLYEGNHHACNSPGCDKKYFVSTSKAPSSLFLCLSQSLSISLSLL